MKFLIGIAKQMLQVSETFEVSHQEPGIDIPDGPKLSLRGENRSSGGCRQVRRPSWQIASLPWHRGRSDRINSVGRDVPPDAPEHIKGRELAKTPQAPSYIRGCNSEPPSNSASPLRRTLVPIDSNDQTRDRTFCWLAFGGPALMFSSISGSVAV